MKYSPTPSPLLTKLTSMSAVVVVNSPATTAPTSHCQTPRSRGSRLEITREQSEFDSEREVKRPSSQLLPPPTE